MPESTRTYLTIVTGLPRSGTSMAMRMLEQAGMPVLIDDHRPADEDNLNGYYEYKPATRLLHDDGWLSEAVGKAVKIVYRLLYALPVEHRYRVILMQRDLSEVLASQVAMLQRRRRAETLADNDMLAGLFRDELRQLDAWIVHQPNMRVLRVNYNDVLEDPSGQVERIADFLDGTLDTRAMRAVVDANLYRHRHAAPAPA